MFSPAGLAPGTLLGLGAVLLTIGGAARLAPAIGLDPFPVPLVAGLLMSAVGPLEVLRPDTSITRAGAEIAVVVLLFCVGLDHGAAARREAAATLPPGRVVAVDAVLNFAPGALFGLLAGFGFTGAVLLGGVTWGSSWAVAAGTLDRDGRFGNRETPAVLAVLVMEHAASAVYLPLAAGLLAPGGAVARLTAVLASAAAIAAAAWLVAGPAPLPRTGLVSGPAPRLTLPLLGAGAALALAGIAAAVGVATAGVAYLAGAVLAAGSDLAEPVRLRRTVASLRELSAAVVGLALGLLVPTAKLPGALAGGLVLAAVTAAGKVLTGSWAARALEAPGNAAIGSAGRFRAGLALVPRGELAVVLGVLAALNAPGSGPGTGLAALAAVEVVVTGVAPWAAVRAPRRVPLVSR